MGAEVAQFDEAWARRITERIRYSAIGVRDGLEKLQSLMAEAQSGNAHELLGYASWTAYISEVMGEEPLRLARDERRDLVAWLSGQGMSTRAIAPIVGTGFKTVARDIEAARGVSDDTPAPVEFEGFTVDHATGEIIDSPPVAEPTVTEHTFTEKIKTVTGLDGKTYKRPEPQAPRAEAITSQFTSAIADLNRVMARIRRIAEDKNFARNKEQVASLHASDLYRTISELETLADSLKGN